ncbi:TetR/AcrR family transcriptional regulator [Arthrobacter echini]|uniref:TetR/AcrR family transcriptional regulator n=1 Tax=Arthrobacter echini TaxID=1529066 RepID=A0A4S5E7X8_9MICC|nr:TetR/AcrR family transcriptional regulator [Arthrobacter echini]THJ67755.1 TetR/AcrR family transcriptional regulator [Arthrobacter echini]
MEAQPTHDRVTDRSIAKATRRAALLDAAAELFADRGYNGVSIEDLGAAAGVSGPAVYRHFAGKPSVLAALLTGVSEQLLGGARAVARSSSSPEEALRGLIRFQVEFALNHADVIRVQDRDLGSLLPDDESAVRSLQRSYVQLWVDELVAYRSDGDRSLQRRRVHAVFGLINSTPHTAHGTGSVHERDLLRTLLEKMAWAALTA